ncbi:hypothetical protein THERMOS_1851 [Bathymodiolus thermophilus thioautotrophic gill symbiont]|uniref:Uncharacterized protein n=1 Tax=Bathymodiolus thermophilus thioautotrophic gill symbiont TaxID=2360 RepID=A0A8H8XGC3_9GAMM|nr:hypothetical protein THERMOS_1851 [Bathymodiolus thermophilus thioautotrophic gill symbiont]
MQSDLLDALFLSRLCGGEFWLGCLILILLFLSRLCGGEFYIGLY